LQIQSTLGLSKADVASLEKLSDINSVQGVYTKDELIEPVLNKAATRQKMNCDCQSDWYAGQT
jgi:putative ABC transport system permease protein